MGLKVCTSGLQLQLLAEFEGNLTCASFSPENMGSWRLDYNGGDEWKVESLPGAHGTNFPDPKVKKYFVTSYG